jgi:hypothetical protein
MVSPSVPLSEIFEKVSQSPQDHGQTENPKVPHISKKDPRRQKGEHHGQNEPNHKDSESPHPSPRRLSEYLHLLRCAHPEMAFSGWTPT